MKKLLSLCIAFILILSFAISAFAEEETKTFYGTTYEGRTNSMEWILVTDGDTQTFARNVAGSSGYTISSESASGARWLLLKVNVGFGWSFSENTDAALSFLFYRVHQGGTSVHILPSGKAEWTKATDALQTGLTGEDKFIAPSLTGAEPSGTYTADKILYNKKCQVKLTADDLEKCYNREDGFLYMTLAVTTTATSLPKLPTSASFNDDKYHSLKLYGMQVFTDPDIDFKNANNSLSFGKNAVTVITNAGAGSAKLVVASYVDDKLEDVMLRTLNAQDAEGTHQVDISSLLSGTVTKAFLLAGDNYAPLTVMAEKTFSMKQETFEGANLKSSSYSAFYSMAEPSFIIPGLNQSIVPQGIEYREATNQFYISGYFKSGSSSVICVVDADSGKIVGEYFLKDTDGSVFSGHVGGVAVDEKSLYISHGCSVYRISLSTIDALGYMGELHIEDKINLSVGTLSADTNRGCSYVDCSNGYLWVGNYYASGSSSYDTPIHEEYNALVRAYKLDSAQPDGFAQENKTVNTEVYDYVPEFMFFVNEQKIQGATTLDNYLILSQSKGTASSKLHIYDRTLDGEKVVMMLDEDREIPIYTLSPEKSVTVTPYSEEITIAGDFAYLIFESGAKAMRDDSGAWPTDSVWKIDLSKLLLEN